MTDPGPYLSWTPATEPRLYDVELTLRDYLNVFWRLGMYDFYWGIVSDLELAMRKERPND